MNALAPWFGFLGAWLLVAGPLYQGALELLEQEVDRAGLQSAIEGLDFPIPLSQWWWLLLPAMIVLRHRATPSSTDRCSPAWHLDNFPKGRA